MEYIEVTINKPLYFNYCFIRDKYIKQARRTGKKLHITIPGVIEGYFTASEWMKNAKRMEKEFKIPGHPMILYGNYVTAKKAEDDRIKYPWE